MTIPPPDCKSLHALWPPLLDQCSGLEEQMLVLFQLMVEGNPLPEAWRRVHYYVFGCAKSKMLIWDCDGILPTMAQLPTHLDITPSL